MSIGHDKRTAGGTSANQIGSSAQGPGKRTLTEQLPLAPGATLEAKAKGKTGPGGERPPGEGAAGPEAGPASPGQLPHGDVAGLMTSPVR